MEEEIAAENGLISDFQGLVTLTLTLDWVIMHTVMQHSSTSAYTPNFIEIEETSWGRTHFIRSTRRSRNYGIMCDRSLADVSLAVLKSSVAKE